jgi:N4-gp56 family major capsid protein
METIVNAGLTITKWRKNYFREYVRSSRFAPYMGKGLNNIIVTMHELEESAGKTIIVPFVGKLTGSGVSGSQVLEGNEEDLGSGNMPVTIDWRRNAVIVPKSEQYKTDIDLLDAAKPALKEWEAVLLRADIIREMGAITINNTGLTTVRYSDATEAEKDTWLALNSDRVLFGKDVSNNSANDHSASLANIDTTNDKANYDWVLKMKRLARAAKITPYESDQDAGQEYFVLFVGTRAFRDLEADSTIRDIDKSTRERGIGKNPLFQGGDLLVRGVIIREEPEISVLAGVGASSSDVEPAYMAGAGAIAIAWGQMPRSKTRLTDYDFRKGVGIEELLGVKKIHQNGVQRSIVTGYVSAAADA